MVHLFLRQDLVGFAVGEGGLGQQVNLDRVLEID